MLTAAPLQCYSSRAHVHACSPRSDAAKCTRCSHRSDAKIHAGGANNAFSDWQRQFRRDAPITFALAAAHLLTFVASTRPRYVALCPRWARRVLSPRLTDATIPRSRGALDRDWDAVAARLSDSWHSISWRSR